MPPPVREGEILAGKFRVERVLGAGGMGVVVAAHHLQLDERVALKFLLPEALESREIVDRFAREARAAAKIKSEHVARVTDVGALPDGAPFMVMEYLEGGDLEAELERRGWLGWEDAIDLVLQALEAIAEAHALGIVHRDLKPANLFLARRRDGSTTLKVLDFGISKMASSDESSGLTGTAAAIGTPKYMAPEQWVSAKHADARSDIWSIGAILYHLIAGHPPFRGDSLPALWHSIANEPLAPLGAARRDVPAELESIVARCLSKEPAGRYPTVADLAVALGAVAPSHLRRSIDRITAIVRPSAVPAAPVAPAQASAHAGTPYAIDLEGEPRSSSRGVLVWGGIALAALAVGAGSWRLLGSGSDSSRVGANGASSAPPAMAASGSGAPIPSGSPVVPASAAVAGSAALGTGPAYVKLDDLPPAAAPPRAGAPRPAPVRPAPQPAAVPPPPAPPRTAPPPKHGNADSFE